MQASPLLSFTSTLDKIQLISHWCLCPVICTRIDGRMNRGRGPTTVKQCWLDLYQSFHSGALVFGYFSRWIKLPPCEVVEESLVLCVYVLSASWDQWNYTFWIVLQLFDPPQVTSQQPRQCEQQVSSGGTSCSEEESTPVERPEVVSSAYRSTDSL